MPKLIPNRFTTYELSATEVLMGSVYNELQLCVLQNHLASKAEEKNNLDFDVNNPNKFAQEEAYAKGAIDMLDFLLESASSSANLLAQNLNTEV